MFVTNNIANKRHLLPRYLVTLSYGYAVQLLTEVAYRSQDLPLKSRSVQTARTCVCL